MAKSIGPTFGGELIVAGLGGLDFSWTNDGSFFYGPSITQIQKNQIQAVYNAHDPVKSSLLDYSENARYNKEVAGITVSGAAFATDLQTQQYLNAVYTHCQINSSLVIQWKKPDFTFTSYTATEMSNIFVKVQQYVESCFNVEATLSTGIKNGTITSNTQIDQAYANLTQNY